MVPEKDGKHISKAVLPLIRPAEKRESSDKHPCRENFHDDALGDKRQGPDTLRAEIKNTIRRLYFAHILLEIVICI